MISIAYQTLADGTLVDYEYDPIKQQIEIRAGRSLTPADRPVILTLTPADAVQLIKIFQDIYRQDPVDIALQDALEQHRLGNRTHDCGEWNRHGVCALCGREL